MLYNSMPRSCCNLMLCLKFARNECVFDACGCFFDRSKCFFDRSKRLFDLVNLHRHDTVMARPDQIMPPLCLDHACKLAKGPEG